MLAESLRLQRPSLGQEEVASGASRVEVRVMEMVVV